MKQHTRRDSLIYTVVPELHDDLFSHHVRPLVVHVFVAVAERGDDVMSDEICHRCNGKQQGGVAAEMCSSQDWVMNKIKKQDTIALT